MGAALVLRARAESRPRLTRTLELAGRRLVRSVLRSRQPRERRVLSLLFYEHLTPAEVAAAMELPPGQVARTLRRALDEMGLAWARLCERSTPRRTPKRGRRNRC